MQATYTLLIELDRSALIPVGKKGHRTFKAGWYAYVGSALNGLEQRIGRHLRRKKKLHWHIDYLLEHAVVRGIIYAETAVKHECRVARSLLETLEPVPGFGCSDCRCPTHLFYDDDTDRLRQVILSGFEDAGLAPLEKFYW